MNFNKLLRPFLISILSFLFLFNNQSFSDENKEITLKKSKTIIYYFHSSIRCETCNKLEDFTKNAVMKYFSKEIDGAIIELKIINIDDKENEHFIKDYDLYMQAVILSKIVDDKEIMNINLDKIWDLVENKEKYYLYIEQEIKEFMK